MEHFLLDWIVGGRFLIWALVDLPSRFGHLRIS
jgi:hypothetical protein